MKKISIIIPMYNSFHMMGRCLGVMEKQTAAEIELIIVDDCSKDDSFEKAQEYAAASKLDIKVVKNDRNGGPGYSRNHGLEYVTGDYVTFIDSDDYLADNFSEAIAPLLDIDVDCVIFDYLNVDEKGNTISHGKSIGTRTVIPGYMDPKFAFVYTYGSTCGKIYKSELVLKHGVKFGELFRSEDMLFTKCALAFVQSVYYSNQELYMYVQHSGSLMHNEALLDERNSQIAFSILKDLINECNLSEELLAVELREVFYSTVLIKVAKREPRKAIVSYVKNNFSNAHFDNAYFADQPKHVKLVTLLAKYKLVFLISLIWKYKQKKRKKAVTG